MEDSDGQYHGCRCLGQCQYEYAVCMWIISSYEFIISTTGIYIYIIPSGQNYELIPMNVVK